MFSYCLPILEGFDLHDDNINMAAGADVIAPPDGDNQITNEGIRLFIFWPYGILHYYFV